jgi:hypothetical protein
VTVAVAVATAILGALLGYSAQAAEFRRDQRLKVYGEFVRASLDVSRTGAALQSLSYRFGDFLKVTNPEWKAAIGQHQNDHDKTRAAFEEAAARIRLVASDSVRRDAERLETWLPVTSTAHGV